MPTTGARATTTMTPGEFLRDHVIPAIPGPAAIYGEAFGGRGGGRLRGPCPIHGGTNKSFSVDAHTLRWHCHSKCGEGGDVLDFLRKTEGYPSEFVPAVRMLAERVGVDTAPLDRPRTPEQAKQDEQRRQRGELLEDFAAWTAGLLTTDEATGVRKYLTGRGVAPKDDDGEPIDYAALGVGYYPDPDRVLAELTSKGHDAEAIRAAGLVSDGRWAGRLLIAMRDRHGTLATFGARDMSGAADPGAKYLYLRGGAKPDVFNLERAFRDPPGKGRSVVVVEGLLDVIVLRSWGFDHALAVGGNFGQLTADRWAAILAPSASVGASVLLATDADETGREKLRKCLDTLRTIDRPASVFAFDPSHYPEGCKDLGDVFQSDEYERPQEAIADLSRYAEPWAKTLARMIAEGVTPSSPAPDRQACAVNLCDLLSDTRPIERDDVLSVATEATGYTADNLSAEAERVREHRKREANAKAVADAARTLAREAGNTTDPHALREMTRSTMAELSSIAGATDDDEPEAFSVAAEVARMEQAPEGEETGWAELDRAGIRLRPSELTVFAGKTGHGKTAALVTLLHHWTRKKDRRGPFLFVSAEEPVDAITRRLLSLETSKKRDVREKWTDGGLVEYFRSAHIAWAQEGPEGEAARDTAIASLKEAVAEIASRESVLQIIYRPGWTAERIAEYALRFRDQHGGCSGVMVDYLQRLPAKERAERRDIDVSAAARRFKHLAVELQAPVIAGAQFNRNKDHKRDELRSAQSAWMTGGGSWGDVIDAMQTMRPDLHDLREGGSEQEADAVFALLNYGAEMRSDDNGNPIAPTLPYEIGALKNRHGSPGRWFQCLGFEGRYRAIVDHVNDRRELAGWRNDDPRSMNWAEA